MIQNRREANLVIAIFAWRSLADGVLASLRRAHVMGRVDQSDRSAAYRLPPRGNGVLSARDAS
jgi:hypothetical protein